MGGNAVVSLGSGTVIWPHGIDIDQDGNVWIADAVAEQRTPEGTRGHQVVKFSQTGELLMRLGTPGKAGGGRDHFNSPADVVVGENGDIFVADGHGNNGNNRVVKFSKDGTYLTEWGGAGSEPGEFRGLHAIEIGPDGRLYVADRSNNRIQIFNQEVELALLTSKWVEVMVEATKSLQPLGAYVFDGAGLMLARRTGTCCTVGSRHTTIQRRSPCASHLYSKSSSVSRNCTSVGSSWIVTMTCRSR